MVAIQAEMVEKEEASKHSVAFGSVGPRIVARDGAGTGSDAVIIDGNDPAGGAL